jgi:hypothetical protein
VGSLTMAVSNSPAAVGVLTAAVSKEVCGQHQKQLSEATQAHSESAALTHMG